MKIGRTSITDRRNGAQQERTRVDEEVDVVPTCAARWVWSRRDRDFQDEFHHLCAFFVVLSRFGCVNSVASCCS